MQFFYKKISQIEEGDTIAVTSTLKDYIKRLNEIAKSGNYESPEASINLAFDDELINKSVELARIKKNDRLKYIVIVGIGGSNLGTMAVYEAIFGNLAVVLNNQKPKMIFLDTNNPKDILDVKHILADIKDRDEILINLISKSGGTTETVANFEVLYDFLKGKIDNFDERVVVTTDFESKLWISAKNKGFSLLEIPKNVGGRYSLFSAVGIFPLALIGIDIKNILEGAKNMRDICLNNDIEKNPALLSAILIFLHNKKGININNSFFFHSQLESVGRWYRQLLGESIGKQNNKNGEEVRVGITPIVSIGSTDLHSMAQLFLGGPKDKFTTFINTQSHKSGVSMPNKLELGELVEDIAGRDFSDIMDAIYKGVKEAYIQNKMPFMEVIIDDINEKELGGFLQFKMMEIIFLAELLNVNAFDQPNVEDYKKETRKILKII